MAPGPGQGILEFSRQQYVLITRSGQWLTPCTVSFLTDSRRLYLAASHEIYVGFKHTWLCSRETTSMPAKLFPTHFLCIPVVTAISKPQLQASLAAFNADVTSPDSFAIPAGAVRPVGTLHLTLGVMSFPKDEGLEKAVELLKSIIPRRILSDTRPADSSSSTNTDTAESLPGPRRPLLSVTLRGLHSMQSPTQSTTLYSPPDDPDGTLQRFCEKLKRAFVEADIMVEDKRPLLLHATIVNTIYVKGRRQGKKREKLTVDARGILERYGDQIWMEDIPIEKIAICRMGAKDSVDGQDQAYEVEAEIDIGNSP